MQIKNMEEKLERLLTELRYAEIFSKENVIVNRQLGKVIELVNVILKESEEEKDESEETEKAVCELEKAAGMERAVYH